MSVQDNDLLKLDYKLQDAATIGPALIHAYTDGEEIKKIDFEVGLLHRGIEKIAEKNSWFGFIPYTDRIDYVAAIHSNLAYVLAVEQLASIEVSDRANSIRVIVSELARIGSHFLNLSSLCKNLGLTTGFMFALREREKINSLFELLCGARLTYSFIRFGGVAYDVTDGFIEKTYDLIDYIVPKLKEYNDLIFNNQIFFGRLNGLAVLEKEIGLAYGITGPNIRASGIKLDVRKIFSYCNYHKFDFEVCVTNKEIATVGDSFSRFFIRLKEIEQSCFIIKQALDTLTQGEISIALPRVFKPPVGEASVSIESPRGMMTVYVKSTGEKRPYRVKIKGPSFDTIDVICQLAKNSSVSDLKTIVSSFDVLISEVDR